MPTTESTSAALLDRLAVALARPTAAEQRPALRTLAHEAIARACADAEVARAFRASPLIGPDKGQVNPRPGTAGLRDMLKPDTMICIVDAAASSPKACREELAQVLDAIREPARHGVRGRTSFIFGRTRHQTDARVRDIRARMTERYANMTPAAKTLASESRRRTRRSAATVPVAPAMPAIDITALTPVALLGAIDRASIAAGRPVDEMIALLAASRTEAARARALEVKALAAARTTAPTSLGDVHPPTPTMLAVESALIALSGRAAKSMKPAALIDRAGAIDAKGESLATANAADTFGIDAASTRPMFNFDVPCFTWGVAHPQVPPLDPDYVFRPMELFRVLMALVSNQRAYLHGHTGTGKTTLVEQVCARLRWPFMRLNFDSEITRMDLIGRDTLVNDGGATVSRFVDGILPQALSGPYVLCFDEIDFVRPDVAYVMQRALEGEGLVLTEDGGRIVKPHPMSRLIATGNTVGQGDEHGMYQGARPQSMALLDRFTVWAHVDYLDQRQREVLIAKRAPELDALLLRKLSQYVEEHITAFKAAKVLQPISPRGMVGLAQALVLWTRHMPAAARREAIQQAFAQAILDRATTQDRVVLKGIADRVFG